MLKADLMLELLLLMADLSSASQNLPVVAEQPKIRSIALYYSPRCPHSQKVLSYLKKMHVGIPLKDVTTDSEAKKELKEVGGHLIVPCLIVNGAPIYNDEDIINWVRDHQDQLPKQDKT